MAETKLGVDDGTGHTHSLIYFTAFFFFVSGGWSRQPGWIMAGTSTPWIPPKNQTLVPPGPPVTSLSACLLFMTPGRSEGTRQEDAFTLSARESLRVRQKLSGVFGNTLGCTSRQPQRMCPCGAKRGICHSNGHFYGLGELVNPDQQTSRHQSND